LISELSKKSWKRPGLSIGCKENVLRRLKQPFVPPQPHWGPFFQRGPKDSLISNMSCSPRVYYGPNDLGKSVAITQALKDRPGVIIVPLRYENPEDIASCFASSIDLFGGCDKVGSTSFLSVISPIGSSN
jgi:hypothetical protein